MTLSTVLISIGRALILAAIVGFVAAGLTYANVWLFRLRTFVMRRTFMAYLRRQRTSHYADIGLLPKPRRLAQQIHAEATEILADGRADLLKRNAEMLADIRRDERPKVDSEINRVWPRARASWKRVARALTLVWSTLILLAMPLSTWFAVLGPGFLLPTETALPPESASQPTIAALQVFASSPQLLIAELLTIAIATWIAQTVVLARDARSPIGERGDGALDVGEPLPAIPTVTGDEPHQHVTEKDSLGGPDRVVRTLNLSSGSFDTVMHLGVAHALWTIQGRAPDAILGVSAGAIQGAAIAETLQHSETLEGEFLRGKNVSSWQHLKPDELVELQRRCELAREKRLREFIEATQQAPEELLAAVLPDAYQIDTTAPVSPLQQPGFARVERQERFEQLQMQSGLTRLYNDLLNIPLSIGTIARIIRRLLGLKAASDVPGRRRRFLVRCIELLRLDLLLGQNLILVSSLIPVLLKAYRDPKRARPTSAAVLLFRSQRVRRLHSLLVRSISFVVLLLAWSIVSTTMSVPYVLVLLGLAYYRWRDPKEFTLRSALLDGLQGFFPFAFVNLFWVGLIAAAMYASALAAAVPFHYVVYAVAALAAAFVLYGYLKWHEARGNPRDYLDRLLAAYDLGNSILTEQGLRALLVKLFDPGYYPTATMEKVVDSALKREQQSQDGPPPDRKSIGWYSAPARLQRIHLGLTLANTSTGRLDLVPLDTPLVEGLLASVAQVPLFPAVELLATPDASGRRQRTLYIDGANVSRDPMRAFFKLLQRRLHRDSRIVHVYSVTPFPVSKSTFGEVRKHPTDDRRSDQPQPPDDQRSGQSQPPRETAAAPHTHQAHVEALAAQRDRKIWLDLIDNVWRALRLQRFRDATLERRLTTLTSEFLPGSSVTWSNDPDAKDPLFRVWLAPIELERDAALNRRILGASKAARRDAVYQTIADGCRASLQVMLANTLKAKATEHLIPDSTTTQTVHVMSCRAAVEAHLDSADIDPAVADKLRERLRQPVGPGLPEICAHCTLWRGEPHALNQNLLRGDWDECAPNWPHERRRGPETASPYERFVPTPPEPEPKEQTLQALKDAEHHRLMKWPEDRNLPAKERPTISLLFSGGVFRGVYQMGVLNGLRELDLRPDVIGGASVGSITAGMVADAFDLTKQNKRDGHARVARLAAVYLAIDRLVLTDRFADFVRRFTLRAGEARFSVRQADRLFRRYDSPTFGEFNRNARDVVAGLGRLFYINPQELLQLIHAIQGHDSTAVLQNLKDITQRFLDRMQIGYEALGTDALAQLITEYVVGAHKTTHPVGLTIDELRQQTHIQLLSTSTDLTRGALRIFGETPTLSVNDSPIVSEVLLASSAFPGVFRPRWSWEALPNETDPVQLMDGGVMDNLPLDAVMQFLSRATEEDLITEKPPAPHLMVAASLEVSAQPYMLAFTRRQLALSWRALQRRAKQLGYNRKLDTYEEAQELMRRIAKATRDKPAPQRRVKPVEAKVVSIKPNWLCSTFAFHPMLGFTRVQQARSIAHGCATTLMTFGRLRTELGKSGNSEWLETWELNQAALPDVTDWTTAFERHETQPGKARDGYCWLRKNCQCPFSRTSLKDLNADMTAHPPKGGWTKNAGPLSEEKIAAVSEIHRLCPERKTHLRVI